MKSHFVPAMVSGFRVLLCHLVSALGLILLPTALGAPPGCVPAPEGLVAWWKGESNAVDSIGFLAGQHLPSPDPWYYTTGKVDTAFHFAQGCYVRIPAAPELNLGAGGGLTIEGWIQPYGYKMNPVTEWNNEIKIIGAGLAVNSGGPGVLEATLWATNVSPYRQVILRSAPYTVSNLVWQHVALTFDKASGSAILYHNGLLVAQTNLGTFTPATTGNFYLGYSPANRGYFLGAMDEISLYNRALGAAGIQAIYLADAAGKCPLPQPTCRSASAAIAGWWRGESNTLDSVAFNHGTMFPTNMPAVLGYSTGVFGNCFSLRTGNYVVIPASAGLDLGSGPGLTVEAWVNSSSSTLPIAEWNSGTGTQGVYLAYSATRGPGCLEANLVDNQGMPHVILSPYIPPVYNQWRRNQWRHVAVTYDQASGAAVLFVNGSPVTQTNLGSFTPQTTGNLYLGYRPSGSYPGSGQKFIGLMDEVTVYRRALTGAELGCVYLAGESGKYPPPTACIAPSEDIVGWWRGESNAVDSVLGNSGLMYPWPQGSYTNGRVGMAFATGFRSYAIIRSPVGLDVGLGPGLTVEAWINPGQMILGSILGWSDSSFLHGVSLDYNNLPWQGNLRANLVDNLGVSHFVTSPAGIVKTGQWQHVALTYDRTSGWGTLFVNGAPVTATNLGIFTPRTTGSLYLGWRDGGPFFIGGLDEVAVYGRALQPFEIHSIYQSLNGRCMEPPVIVEQPVDVRVNQGGNAVFHVLASGNPLLRYQWNFGELHRFSSLKDATNATLILTNWQRGPYFARVTNAFGAANSTVAWLSVNHPPVADASATKPLLIVPSGCRPTVVLDGSRSYDRDRDADPLQHLWFKTGETTAFATGVVTMVTLPLGTHPLTLVVDDGLATDTNTISVTVVTARETVQGLIALVRESDIGHPKPLLTILSAAADSIRRHHPRVAILQLRAFQQLVRVVVNRHDPVLAAELSQAAEQVIEALSQDCALARPHWKLGKLHRHDNGGIRMEFSATEGRSCFIEASTNLVDWEVVGEAIESGAGEFEFEDLDAARLPARFYRIVTQ